jgi:hypothetical protein
MDRSESIDRALLAACAVVWLAAIGVGVAAIVALVGMGSGRAGAPAAGSGTPWGLYVVIAVSAAIILGSIPLLLRARRAAQQEPPPRRPPATARTYPGEGSDEGATEKLRVFGAAAGSQPPASPYARGTSPEMVDRMWLRFAASMAIAMGAATLAVATATYFMGVRDEGSAWAALTVAGIITAAMPIIPWRQLRQLRAQT